MFIRTKEEVNKVSEALNLQDTDNTASKHQQEKPILVYRNKQSKIKKTTT